MLTLAVALYTLIAPCAQEDPAALLQFLAATQKQTSEAYEKLSYECEIASTSFDTTLKQEVTHSSHYKLLRRADTTLLTSELYTSIIIDEQPAGGGGPTYKVSEEPSVMLVLKSPDYIVVWSDMNNRSVLVYFAEDWRDNMASYETNFEFSYQPVSIVRRCFGQSNPFYQLYETKGSLAKWQVLAFEEGNSIKVQRQLPDSEMNYHVDLNLTLSPDDGLMMEAEFKPPRDTVVNSVTATYSTIMLGGRELRVPSIYRHRSAGGPPELSVTNEITYTNFLDESALPPLTLNDMGIPKGIGLARSFTDGHTEPKGWNGKPLSIETWRTKR